MPRAPRIEFEGATFYISARGNRGERIFADREDSLKFLSIFETMCSDHDWDCFGFVLMPGSYQLILRTNRRELGRGIQRLNGRYAGWVNRRRETSGHLLGGRYQAVLVDTDNWLLPLVRLCALAPVRAGLAERPEQWLWSSWRSLIEERTRETPPFLAQGEVMAGTDVGALAAFVARGLDEDREDVRSLEMLMRHNQVVGSRSFARAAQTHLGLNTELTSTQPHPVSHFRQTVKPSDRAMAAAYFDGGYRQKDIAAAFDTHVSTVSRAGAKYQSEFVAPVKG